MRYRRLPTGEINHSSKVQLLDRDGRIVAQTGRVNGVDPDFLESVNKMLDAEAR